MSRPTLETPQGRDEYLRSYREGLLADTLPFWFPRCLDTVHGGYLHCRDADGTLIDTDKSVWAQGRMAWMLLELFNRFEKRPEWLHWA
ncbi:MAG: N-acylglucosamine 2-epimerase, partial [Planctomycetota bacterium]